MDDREAADEREMSSVHCVGPGSFIQRALLESWN